ncbi:CorA family divalent cation transporter [Acinetobacter baumannii]|uniref:CorA family divalent cation transporter n=1 Tax=Acinetobacter baumannii TaxID=470 RepID=UPI003BA94374
MEVKKYASFEYEQVRYLQNAVTNIKQNQIIKVFTIITAVFLSLTLVGTFYGMDFDVMPELSWEHGFFILYDTYFSSSDNTFSIY